MGSKGLLTGLYVTHRAPTNTKMGEACRAAQHLLHWPQQQHVAGSGHGAAARGTKKGKKRWHHAADSSRAGMMGNSGVFMWHRVVCNLTLMRGRNRSLGRFLHREKLLNLALPGGAEHIHHVPQAACNPIFHLFQYTDLQKSLVCNCCGAQENTLFFATFRTALTYNPVPAGMQGPQVRKAVLLTILAVKTDVFSVNHADQGPVKENTIIPKLYLQ